MLANLRLCATRPPPAAADAGARLSLPVVVLAASYER